MSQIQLTFPIDVTIEFYIYIYINCVISKVDMTCILVNCKVRNYDDLFSSKNYDNLFGMVHSILYNEDEVSIYAMISSRVMDSLFVKVKSYF